MASCRPPWSGRPSATTSRRRASAMGAPRSKSRTKMLVVTRAPASLQIRAAALSTANPRLPNTPARAACCTMVATRVKWTATSAEARGRREGKVETTEQQDAEERGVEPHERTRRDRREGHATACSALSTQQSTFCDSKPAFSQCGLGCDNGLKNSS